MPPAAPEFRMALLELLRQYQGDRALDVLREGVRLLAEALMELEVSEQVGAGRYERTPERKTYRNGYRERVWETRVGQIPLRIPKLRQGSYFPSLLEPRRRAERALVSVVQEAYVAGVSTRKVDDLVRALGLEGCSRSEVSRICRELDEAMERFRSRPLEGEYPYVWLDAKAVRVRYDGRVVPLSGGGSHWGTSGRVQGSPGVQRRGQRDLRVLGGVPAAAGGAGVARGAAGDL